MAGFGGLDSAVQRIRRRWSGAGLPAEQGAAKKVESEVRQKKCRAAHGVQSVCFVLRYLYEMQDAE